MYKKYIEFLFIYIYIKTSPKNLELIKEFSNVAEYKITVQKLVAFLHTSYKLPKIILRKQSHLQSHLNA